VKGILLSLYLSIFSFSVLASSSDTLHIEFQKVNPKTGVIFKMGGYASGDNLNTSFNSFSLGPAFEIAFSEKITVNLGAETQESLTSYSNDATFGLDIRYYIKPLYSLKKGNGFSGMYVAPSFHKMISYGAANELPFSVQEFPYINRPLQLDYGIGVKLGQQYQGMVDFGIFVGVEKSREHLNSFDNTIKFGSKSTFYPIVNSYGKIALPIGNKEFNRLLKANLNQKVQNNYLVKFGLNDAFSFSKKGVFFHPQIGYEKALGNSGFSVNAKAEGIIFRAKYFDVESVQKGNEFEFTVSEKPYLHQYIEFVFNPQIRYYVSHKNIERNGSFLEGFYFHTAAQLRSGAEEIKRNIWYYDKFSSASFGGGGGAQKIIMGNVLLDAHASIFHNNMKDINIYFGGGIDLYWVK
jgi:hypothetical protein